MHCPNCGLYHPSNYANCVSCGTQLASISPESVHVPVRSPVRAKQRFAVGIPGRQLTPAAKISIAVAIVIVSAATTFFLLRPSNESVLYDKAQKELASGQYAFAASLLEQLAVRSPKDPRVFLALARAYVGIDQVDRAWACIARAQQLGAGVIADPSLTYQLANYYRQRGSFDRAAQLLRPLAASNRADARMELSDLDAAWGDELMGSNLEQALHCWEEVQTLNTGSRLSEAPSRLATIYQRYADKLITEGNDKEALAVLDKLNALAQNPAYHEMTAGVYERMGLFDKACDQLRTAISLAGPQSELNAKLAVLLTKYGKQLMDSGDTERGYDCLLQASDLDKTIAVPSIVLKDVNVDVNPVNRHAQMSASVYNAGSSPANRIKIEAQLISTLTSRVMWQSTQSLIGEYDPSLDTHSSKLVKFESTVPVRSDGSTAFNIYINSQFYKSYPLGKKFESSEPASSGVGALNMPAPAPAATNIQPTPSKQTSAQGNQPGVDDNPFSFFSSGKQNGPKPLTPEDQTLKDLER
jgi:tetratricopeptide (TPR) repeat protein